ncbi:class A sortase [Apilactobacillus micheneri]|uniref:class A sortase n=1 Tax=Apilactobacillus micheneri TaxID=1899430 RepID=UPI000D50D04A|nr:class A sortase [Apilactobacillus micheneri]GAY79944.1 hypothetical protein NBRC113063_00808 [Apilactobacillus micheneri]
MLKKYLLYFSFTLFLSFGIIIILSENIKTDIISSYNPTINRKIVLSNQSSSYKANYSMDKVKPVTISGAMKSRLNSKNIKVVGKIFSPSIGMNLPIGLGVDNYTLMLCAGTMKSNQTMGTGNYSIAGHHMINRKALFSPLYYKCKLGTIIYLTNMNKVYKYKVTKIRIISPYDVSVINNTYSPKLTLITCNNNGSKRLFIRGKLEKSFDIKKSSKKVIRYINSSMNNKDVLKGY